MPLRSLWRRKLVYFEALALLAVYVVNAFHSNQGLLVCSCPHLYAPSQPCHHKHGRHHLPYNVGSVKSPTRSMGGGSIGVIGWLGYKLASTFNQVLVRDPGTLFTYKSRKHVIIQMLLQTQWP